MTVKDFVKLPTTHRDKIINEYWEYCFKNNYTTFPFEDYIININITDLQL